MSEALVDRIRTAFSSAPYPGDAFLVGSRDGCEPYDTVSQFFGRTEWSAVEPELLDACYTALSFFSEAGFRFFLPAYLIADVRGQLQTADPVFHLTHGFHLFSQPYDGLTRTFLRASGGSALLNPKRYGAIVWEDHARFRLSVFCREEAAAIVEYLEFRRHREGFDAPAIDAALAGFWRVRAASAPDAAAIAAMLADEAAFAAELQQKLNRPPKTEP